VVTLALLLRFRSNVPDMGSLIGKWLFPDAAPDVRKLRMEVVYFIAVVLLLLCAGVVVGLWLFYRPQLH